MKPHQYIFGLLGLGVIMLGLVLTDIVKEFKSRHMPPTVWWHEYTASTDAYKVRISESMDLGRKNLSRLLFLTSLTNEWVTITGHDYNCDGEWDRVFWCGVPDPKNGCNSYIRTKTGWTWSPCPANEEMEPIPQSEIPVAVARLNGALKFRRIENLTTLWTYMGTTDLHAKATKMAE